MSEREVVGDPRLGGVMDIQGLANVYKEMGGFTAKYLIDAVECALKMYSGESTTVFFSFTANLIATGLRSVIAEFIKRGFVDVVFTTGGTIDHDIARSLGGKYYIGEFDASDVELRAKGIHRLGNVFIPKDHYGPFIEKFTHEVLEELCEDVNERLEIGVRELLWHIGSKIKDDNSILRACFEGRVPIYSPGVVDSAFGTALFTFREVLRTRGKNLVLDVLKDMKELSEIVHVSKELGGLILGGGISKHHLIWWSQFKGGLKYAIYITTAIEWDGSLSGARTREAISWGKVHPKAKHVTVYGDATVLFPLFLAFLYAKIGRRSRSVKV